MPVPSFRFSVYSALFYPYFNHRPRPPPPGGCPLCSDIFLSCHPLMSSWVTLVFLLFPNASHLHCTAAPPWAHLVCVFVLSHVQLVCNLMAWRPPVSSVHEISQARILKWVAISHSRGSSHISCIDRWILYQCTTWAIPGHLLLGSWISCKCFTSELFPTDRGLVFLWLSHKHSSHLPILSTSSGVSFFLTHHVLCDTLFYYCCPLNNSEGWGIDPQYDKKIHV